MGTSKTRVATFVVEFVWAGVEGAFYRLDGKVVDLGHVNILSVEDKVLSNDHVNYAVRRVIYEPLPA